MRDPILIVGPARSGTSMTAGIFAQCGAWTGPCVGPGPHNRKGLFENFDLREDIVKQSLREAGADPLGVASFPSGDYRPKDLRKRVEDIITRQGYDGNQAWVWKTIKSVPMWRAWHDAFPNATWLLCYRSPTEIARSCMRTSFMREHGLTEQQWYMWALQYHIFMTEINSEVNNSFYVIADRLARREPEELAMLRQQVKRLGLQWGDESVEAFIDPQLWGGQDERSAANPS